jgi:hypothetical protein
LLKFLRLLNANNFNERIFTAVNNLLAATGLLQKEVAVAYPTNDTLSATTANVNDFTLAQTLLHVDETSAFGNAGHQGESARVWWRLVGLS